MKNNEDDKMENYTTSEDIDIIKVTTKGRDKYTAILETYTAVNFPSEDSAVHEVKRKKKNAESKNK